MGFRLKDGHTTVRLPRNDRGFFFHAFSTVLHTSQLRMVIGTDLAWAWDELLAGSIGDKV
jgi:hypothetical protein